MTNIYKREKDFKSKLHEVAGNSLIHNAFESADELISSYNFRTAIVKEVISNPYEYLNQQVEGEDYTVKDFASGRLSTFKDGTKVPTFAENKQLVDYMPLNSIVAYIIDGAGPRKGSLPVICYPFFPQHLSLPIKPGEYIWVIKENNKGNSYYYWVCKKTTHRQIDDVNFTHHERGNKIVDIYENWVKLGSKKADDYELQKANNNDTRDNLTTRIFNDSYAFRKEFTGEPVPRLAKNCGDYLIQGSNNAGILLTNERFQLGNESPSDMTNQSSSELTPNRKPQSPAIDIFVHRKYDDLTSISSQKNLSQFKSSRVNLINNHSVEPSITHYEIDKTADALTNNTSIFEEEINDTIDDVRNVSNRIYMSSNSNIDELFSINFDNLETVTGPAGIFYSKNARVFGENSLRIGTIDTENYIDMHSSGEMKIKASQKVIVMNGSEAYVKLSALKNVLEFLQEEIVSMASAAAAFCLSSSIRALTVLESSAGLGLSWCSGEASEFTGLMG